MGSERRNANIKPMPHKGSSPRSLDLFEYTLTVPSPPSGPATAATEPSELARLSDAQLAQRLGQLVTEVLRRLGADRASRPELEAAVRQAGLAPERLCPRPPKQGRALRKSQTSSVLQEGQRKAVRAALQAGVAPSRVAKHFGL